VRGGVWDIYAYTARCANRSNSYPNHDYYEVGFRCVRRL
jgi:formylglycine-generating enzyme required for sulfatase activity